jgi:hypothetical protein
MKLATCVPLAETVVAAALLLALSIGSPAAGDRSKDPPRIGSHPAALTLGQLIVGGGP